MRGGQSPEGLFRKKNMKIIFTLLFCALALISSGCIKLN